MFTSQMTNAENSSISLTRWISLSLRLVRRLTYLMTMPRPSTEHTCESAGQKKSPTKRGISIRRQKKRTYKLKNRVARREKMKQKYRVKVTIALSPAWLKVISVRQQSRIALLKLLAKTLLSSISPHWSRLEVHNARKMRPLHRSNIKAFKKSVVSMKKISTWLPVFLRWIPKLDLSLKINNYHSSRKACKNWWKIIWNVRMLGSLRIMPCKPISNRIVAASPPHLSATLVIRWIVPMWVEIAMQIFSSHNYNLRTHCNFSELSNKALSERSRN